MRCLVAHTLACFAVVGLAASGCSNTDPALLAAPSEGAGGAADVTSSSSTAPTVVGSSSTSSSSSGGMGPDGNSLATAKPLPADATGYLDRDDPVDWWVVEVGETDFVRFDMTSNQGLDPTLTIFDEGGEQVAASLDFAGAPSPQHTSRLTEGTYFLRVQEGCAWLAEALDSPCDDPADYTAGQYTLRSRKGLHSLEVLHDETEVGPATAVALAIGNTVYARGLYGFADSPGDVDTFALSLPQGFPGTVLPGTRPTWRIRVPTSGPTGTGSTLELDRVWISDREDPAAPDAQVFASTRIDEFEYWDRHLIPMIPGPTGTVDGSYQDLDTLYLHVRSSADTVGANPFYRLLIRPSSSYLWETEPNDDPLTNASQAEAGAQTSSSATYLVAGEVDEVDVDAYAIDLLASGVAQPQSLRATCWAVTIGSGVNDLTFDVFADDTTLLASSSSDETTPHVQVQLPSGATSISVRISAGTPSVDIDWNHYYCAFEVN